MSLFVDFVGMNTLVSSSIDGNTVSSGKNALYTSAQIADRDELAGINLHRNGPYGYSTWTQLRASENPITRHHRENNTLTFVVQPGPLRNVSTTGELRVRDRYSAINTFTEPAIAQKAYPLTWNVGRHIKDANGNVDDNIEKFSIVSSFSNQLIGFANERVNKLLKFDPLEENTEYNEIYSLYADGGIESQESPLSYWEFLQYRETVYPHMKNQFRNDNLERPNFTSFYRHNREDRREVITTGLGNLVEFGINVAGGGAAYVPFNTLDRSSWPLDSSEIFTTYEEGYGDPQSDLANSCCVPVSKEGTRIVGNTLTGPTAQRSGILQNNYSQLNLDLEGAMNGATAASVDHNLFPSPYYNRRHTLSHTASVSNPSGMIIQQTGGLSQLGVSVFHGQAEWDAGNKRHVKDSSGQYVLSPKKPFYDTYENFIEEARRKAKNHSVVPEFRISTQVEDYVLNKSNIELDMFEVTGGKSGAENSSSDEFYEVYSNSDFMRQFELVSEDHKEISNGQVLSLRCSVVKKFLPYKGFYPCQRVVDLAERFYNSYEKNINLFNQGTVNWNSDNPNFHKQFVMGPLFAPGVLMNTIKSGVAVDYPIITTALNNSDKVDLGGAAHQGDGVNSITNNFDTRIPFEALLEPENFLKNIELQCLEPHPSGALSSSAIWDGTGDELYGMMANNFLAEIPEFFLNNGKFTSLASKKQGDGFYLKNDTEYAMRIAMYRSMDKARTAVSHLDKSVKYLTPQDIILQDNARESFTMYSRPSAFGPPSRGRTTFASASNSIYHLSESRERVYEPTVGASGDLAINRDSHDGFNFPFTPPYYHGQAWVDIVVVGTGKKTSLEEIQQSASFTYTRFDSSFYIEGNNRTITGNHGPQSFGNINNNAMQISASLNLLGLGRITSRTDDKLVVDSSLEQDFRWIIQTKFETPMLNFNHVTSSDHFTIPNHQSESVPRGMWHQYGRTPESDEGVFMSVGKIDEAWQESVLERTTMYEDLSAKLGFSNKPAKIGKVRSAKTVSEAVVAVPFLMESGRKKFFKIDKKMVTEFKKGGSSRSALTQGNPQNQIGRSVLNQLNKMGKYIFPPSFDFINGSEDEIEPIAMYIFEFHHTFNQQDLIDIWQNLPPDFADEMETDEVIITHPILKKELLGPGGEKGNTLIDLPTELKWMVFKVKQRASNNYFKKSISKNEEGDSGESLFSDFENNEFGINDYIQYNWPYDFFSTIELVKIDAEVELGNFRPEDIANYTDSIPDWDPIQATTPEIILADVNDSGLSGLIQEGIAEIVETGVDFGFGLFDEIEAPWTSYTPGDDGDGPDNPGGIGGRPGVYRGPELDRDEDEPEFGTGGGAGSTQTTTFGENNDNENRGGGSDDPDPEDFGGDGPPVGGGPPGQ